MSNFLERLEKALLEDLPAAPAKPKPVKPAPAKPAPSPKEPAPSQPIPDPFNPTKPAVLPRPKAKKKQSYSEEITYLSGYIEEAYEDEVHQSTRNFWSDLPRNKKHPFSKHPILAMHGNKLARGAHGFTSEKVTKQGGHLSPQEQYQIFMEIMQVERQHTEELIELAKDITVKIWGIDRDMLDPRLGEAGDLGDQDRDQDQEVEITQELRDQINKRLTLNAMTQGSAVHAMFTMHHLVDKAINRINPRLLELYNKLATSSVHQYWLMELPISLMQLTGMAAGSETVEYDEEGQPKVVASGVCFPILTQELSKGVMELITMRGLSDLDAQTLKTIYKHADKLEDEPFLIQVGPELWRKFLKVVPKGVKLSNLISALSALEPKKVNLIINAVVEKPEQATELISKIME